MTIDQRIGAVTVTLESAVHQTGDQRKAIEKDREDIRALARIAEARKKLLSRMEG